VPVADGFPLGGGSGRRRFALAHYFLVAKEAVEIVRERGVAVTGRGSAANSLVARCLHLTRPDPFEHRLLFERFLHEGREDPPDIDLDFDSEYRDSVRNELMERYSHLGCAVAATAQTYSLRGAVRVAARALGYSPSEIDALAKNVPRRIRDRDRTVNYESQWDTALRSPAMKNSPLQDRKRYALLLELSERLEGRLARPGTHLGGLVLGTSERHLSEIVPLEPSGKPGLLRTQYDKDDLEAVRLPKLDLLGLKMHTALRKAGELVSARLGREVDPLSPTPDDRKTFELIRSGETAGVFQLESPGQMSLQRGLKPRRLAHIVSGISLFRPGPLQADLVTPYVARKNGEEPYSVPLPELEEILRPTYGVLVYQEQLLEMAQRVSGCSLAEADSLRRAMKGRSDPQAMRGLRAGFVRRAIANGVPAAKAREVFSWMEGFGRYGFSAAHAASFAHLAYASAFMMAHYPAEMIAGLLNSMPCGFYSPRVLLNEARRKGLRVLPPDIHLSGEGITLEQKGRALRVGLSFCKGLSDSETLYKIVAEREEEPFSCVADLYRRTSVQRDVLENLIRAGLLDVLAPKGSRAALLADTRRVLPAKRSRKGSQAELSFSSYEHPASWWSLREGRRSGELLRILPPPSEQEREQAQLLGLDVPGRPLAPHRQALLKMSVSRSRELFGMPAGGRARVAGLFECLQAPPTRSGKIVHFLLTEDESGLLQSTIFEKCYRRYGHVLYESGAYLLEGRVEQDARRGFSFVLERIFPLSRVLGEASRKYSMGQRDDGGEDRFTRVVGA
jgi:error-prone DNA polymerase